MFEMTCSNWMLTIAAILTIIFAVWPAMVGLEVAKWIIVIIAVVVLIIAWTCIDCRLCKDMKPGKAKRK